MDLFDERLAKWRKRRAAFVQAAREAHTKAQSEAPTATAKEGVT